MFFTEHKDLFEQEMRRMKYSNRTIKNYLSNTKRFFEWCKKDHPKNVNEADIKEYLLQFTESNTQRSHHGAIKLFYKICLNQKNKFKYIPYCKKSHKLPIVLSQEEIQRMFDVCDNLKHKVIFGLLYSCGLRVSELINLKWENLDRSRKIINIIGGKGNKDRQVMLSDNIIPLLEKYYYSYHSKIYILNGQNEAPQYSIKSVNEIIHQLAKKAGIKKKVYTHLIRHCMFTHLLENGTDLYRIQLLAGHSSPKSTAIYAHTSHKLISQTKSPIININL